jgi:hypothetical protein
MTRSLVVQLTLIHSPRSSIAHLRAFTNTAEARPTPLSMLAATAETRCELLPEIAFALIADSIPRSKQIGGKDPTVPEASSNQPLQFHLPR